MTTEQSFPITEILEEQIKIYDTPWNRYVLAIKQILPQVKALEEESITRAKEEEIERIVGILGTMKNESYSWIDFTWKMSVEDTLQEAITRITN